MTYGSAWPAARVPVWVALSDSGAAHLEAASALQAEVERTLPGRVDWRVAHWRQFDRARPEPKWIVAVGTAAQHGMQELFAADSTPPPLLAILVPHQFFERIATPARLRAGSLSAVFLDQPAGRQMELIRLALPTADAVGILVGAESKLQAPDLERAAKERGMRLMISLVGQTGLFPALQSLLRDVDVVLALPDPEVFNGQTAGNILTATYRRRVPLIGFSPAYVKAGAYLALYSTPTQIGSHGGDILRQAWSGNVLPRPQWPADFVVKLNPDVAHSLGLGLNEAALAEQLRKQEAP
jgi:hypothetical protein